VRTPHNPWRQEANRKIADLIAPNLGPGDVLRIIHVTGTFAPHVNVWGFLEWPALPEDLRKELVDENSCLRVPENMADQGELQARLDEAWDAASDQITALSDSLLEERIDPHLHEGEGIDLERPLHYALEALSKAPGEHWLVIFGPLLHQPTGATSPLELEPPANLTVENLRVLNLFVPYQNMADSGAYNQRWTEYFQRVGASFEAKDRAVSWNLSEILPPSGVPQEVPLPAGLTE
jgi:hypothetical protein